ncbi:hypothetical protein NUU61_001799 [Penicillium alfredii]|uniref:NmrA-like domain-containing protein n=1 Tax=Penicillium alfredii TaxID=1506179 RepID=A0A9W9FQZ4_9EURO|nr:uncharacterized protein NUU61_001799 [Penicillium alfredii]KAJ5104452.1 hypothetical protein NUU61_001799 [Penicillium alfredii]
MPATLITGATGKQGGAVINALLRNNAAFEILAVTRNAQSSSAQRLANKSPKIRLVEGNLDEPATLFQNARKTTSAPIWGVFSVQSAFGKGEERQGKALVDEALKHGVKHFVYSSVDRGGAASIDNPTGIPHFVTKHRIEQHLLARSRDSDMRWTVLRPVAFMDNLTPDFGGKVFATMWRMALKGKPLQLIATSDIGLYAADAFLQPDQYRDRFISLAGDDLTFTQMANIFQSKTGTSVPTTFELPCRLLMATMAEMGTMFRWFHDEGYRADIAALRKDHPGLKDFASWLETESGFLPH